MMIMEVLQVWEEYEEEEKVELVKVMVMMMIMEVLQVWEEYEEEEKVELVKELSAWKQRYLQPTLKRKSVSTVRPTRMRSNIPLLEPGSPRFFWWYENSE